MPDRAQDDDDYDVSVTATIDGHPESVLRELQTAKANTKKTIKITLRLRKPPYGFYDYHWLPQIANGDTNDAEQHLRMLFRQGLLTSAAHERISMLIDNFGRATR
jgi:hypothetical protein